MAKIGLAEKLLIGGIAGMVATMFIFRKKASASDEEPGDGDEPSTSEGGVNLLVGIVNAPGTTDWSIKLVDGSGTKLLNPTYFDEGLQFIPVDQAAEFIIPEDTEFPLRFVSCRGLKPSQVYPDTMEGTFDFQSWNPDRSYYDARYEIDYNMFTYGEVVIDITSGYIGS